MVRIIDRFSYAALAAFCLGVVISACSQSGKPQIEPGTSFEQVQPGSSIYREIPKDRPMKTSIDQK